MAEKKVNYTDEMTAELVKAYEAAEDEAGRESVIVEKAEEFGKTVRSIRAKLSREGVYVAKTYKSKTGDTPERKASIVQDIASALGVDSDVVGSLEKATKPTLNLLRGTLQKAREALGE